MKADRKLCALCYHDAECGELCVTCNSDWQQSRKIAAKEKAVDSEYHGLVDGTYSEQSGYIAELFARCERDGVGKVEAMRRVTRSICEELGCKSRHGP
jgi:hypothetical protein